MTAETLIVQPALPDYRRGFLELVAQKIPVHLICSDSSPDGVESDVTDTTFVHEIVSCVALPAYLFWQKGVVASVIRRSPATLVIGGNPRYLSSIVAMVVAKLKGIRVIWWGHARSSTSKSFSTWLRTRMMFLADRILVYYPEEIALLPERLRGRAVGVNNSIDTGHILKMSDEISDVELDNWAASNGFERRPLMVTLGRLTQKARVDRIIRALAILKGEGSNAMLVVIGDGPQKDDLVSLAETLDVEDSIVWAGEILEESRLALWMRSACLFVYGGAVGLSLIHAFAYGLPAVISSQREDHNPEALLFVDGKLGATFNAQDDKSLAAVLKEQLEDLDNLAAMGHAAKQMVEDRLGIERMADRFVDAVSDSANRPS